MTVLFSIAKTNAAVLDLFAKILFQLLIRKRYVNFSWNLYRGQGSLAKKSSDT